jgi:hypothetical protein
METEAPGENPPLSLERWVLTDSFQIEYHEGVSNTTGLRHHRYMDRKMTQPRMNINPGSLRLADINLSELEQC